MTDAVNVSVFGHPWLGALFRDDELAAQFEAGADIEAMLEFESALATVSAEYGIIPEEAATAIASGCAAFDPDYTALASATRRDGVVVPELLRQLRFFIPDSCQQYLHFGATSQDVIDTSLVIRLRQCLTTIGAKLLQLTSQLESLEREQGDLVIMAHTRMQAALEVSASVIISAWNRPLYRHLQRLAAIRARVLQLQLGGPVGDLSRFADKGDSIRDDLAAALDLDADADCWHSGRDNLAELSAWCVLVTGSIGKLGQDVALMTQSEVQSVSLAATGGSSSMAHKQNPVSAELLVAIAGFVNAQNVAMQQALLHEQQRSGSAWTMEWMVLPQIIIAANAALNIAIELVNDLAFQEGD